jgi:prepilin-type N-terminal cleavage/methylation domain-containing protein
MPISAAFKGYEMNTPQHPRRRPRGFTLLEILAVVAIVGIVAAIGFTVMSRARTASYRARCDVQLKAIALALDAYRQEQDHFPDDLRELETNQYVTDKSIMRCPADPDPLGSYANFYVIRTAHDQSNLPLLVCPFHEGDSRGVQAYVGRYTTEFMTKPATLTDARATIVRHPGKNPVSAPAGLELHGADVLQTANNGSATIQFADGSWAQLKKNTTVTILQSFMDNTMNPQLYTLIRQTGGDADYDVHPGSKFEVVTPAATAGALGTHFKIRVAPNTDTTLLVTKGKVRFNTSRRYYKVVNMVPVTAKKSK